MQNGHNLLLLVAEHLTTEKALTSKGVDATEAEGGGGQLSSSSGSSGSSGSGPGSSGSGPSSGCGFGLGLNPHCPLPTTCPVTTGDLALALVLSCGGS